MTYTEQLRKEISAVEKKLEKNRPTVFSHGWQTQRFAKADRNWDHYAQRKMRLLAELDSCESKDIDDMCSGCDCWKQDKKKK